MIPRPQVSSSTVTTPRASTPKEVISPAHAQYVQRQARTILLNGGSPADVSAFFQTEKERPAGDIPVTFSGGPDPQREVGLIEGLSMRALNGITFGFGDEALGRLLGGLSEADDPQAARRNLAASAGGAPYLLLSMMTGPGARGGEESYKAELESFSRDHPVAGLAAELLGGLLTGKVGLNALREARGVSAATPSILEKIAEAGTIAGAEGAAFGAGSAEGDLSDRALGAILGGTLGAAIGATGSGVGQVVGAVAKPVLRGMLPDVIQTRLPGLTSAAEHADAQILDELAVEGLTIDELRRAAYRMQATGTPFTIADLGGVGLTDLAGRASAGRSAGRQRLNELLLGRQAEQGERLSGDLFRRIFRGADFGLKNAYDAEDMLHTARKAAADPLYAQAFDETIPVGESLRELLENPMVRRAWDAGRLLADDEAAVGLARGLDIPALPSGNAVPEMLANASPEFKALNPGLFGDAMPTELPVRGLHYAKLGVDAVVEQLASKPRLTAFDKSQLRVAAALKSKIVDELAASPTYDQARRVYADYSAAHDASRLGREFLTKPPEVVTREVAELTPGHRDFYRLGAAQTLYEKMGSITNENADLARRFFGGRLWTADSQDARRIRALFPDAPEVADDFMAKVAAEARLSFTTARGARTPSGNAINAGVDAAEGAIPQARGQIRIQAMDAFLQGVRRLRGSFQNEVGDELAVMFSRGLDGGGPADVHRLLDRLQDAKMRLIQARLSGSSDIRALATGILAGKAGGSVTR